MPAINNDFALAFKVTDGGSYGLGMKEFFTSLLLGLCLSRFLIWFYLNGVNRAIIMKMNLRLSHCAHSNQTLFFPQTKLIYIHA